jgi:hypothetical protein
VTRYTGPTGSGSFTLERFSRLGLVHSLSCSLPFTNRQGALGALFGSTLVSTGDTPD